MKFKEFLSDKKLEYMVANRKSTVSDAEFTDYLNELLQQSPDARTWRLDNHRFSPVTVDRWLLGGSLPVEDNLWSLVAIYGSVVCQVLGIPHVMPRDPELRLLIDLWVDSSEAARREVMEFAEMRLGRKITPKGTAETVLHEPNG